VHSYFILTLKKQFLQQNSANNEVLNLILDRNYIR
jgi:hypothetical protein